MKTGLGVDAEGDFFYISRIANDMVYAVVYYRSNVVKGVHRTLPIDYDIKNDDFYLLGD